LVLIIPFGASILLGVGLTPWEVIFFVSTFGGVNLRLLVVSGVLNLGCTTILSGVFYLWNFDVGEVVSL